MDTIITIYNYMYVTIYVLAFFLAIYVLIQKTRDLRSRKLKELRILDIPLVLTLFVVTTLNYLAPYNKGTFPVGSGVLAVVSTILLVWYIALIVYSKRLKAREDKETKTTI